ERAADPVLRGGRPAATAMVLSREEARGTRLSVVPRRPVPGPRARDGVLRLPQGRMAPVPPRLPRVRRGGDDDRLPLPPSRAEVLVRARGEVVAPLPPPDRPVPAGEVGPDSQLRLRVQAARPGPDADPGPLRGGAVGRGVGRRPRRQGVAGPQAERPELRGAAGRSSGNLNGVGILPPAVAPRRQLPDTPSG